MPTTREIFNDPAVSVAFGRDGYVILDLLQEEDVRSLLDLYQSVSDLHSHDFFASILSSDTDARKRIHEGIAAVLAERVSPILRDYRIAVGSFAVKLASSEQSKVGLHQDVSFVDERDGHVSISVWCPLVDVNEENGHLGVVPKSHLLNRNYRDSCSLPYIDLLELIEDEFLHYQSMAAGQVLLMDSRVFHGSPKNSSPETRVVAAGVAVPAERPLIYCHRDWQVDDGTQELFEVEPNHYVYHQFGVRPARGRSIRIIERQVEKLTEQRLRNVCPSVVAGQ